MSPAKNTVSMVVLCADSGVYLCNFFRPNPDLHNLKKSSIFPRTGLYCFQFSIFSNNWSISSLVLGQIDGKTDCFRNAYRNGI